MKTYDLYLFGTNPDVIVGWHQFKSAGHEAAIIVAVAMALDGAQELWLDDVLIKRWDKSN